MFPLMVCLRKQTLYHSKAVAQVVQDTHRQFQYIVLTDVSYLLEAIFNRLKNMLLGYSPCNQIYYPSWLFLDRRYNKLVFDIKEKTHHRFLFTVLCIFQCLFIVLV